ncbi:MAG: hypothetical protein FD168_1656 [Desulfobulbaceae bacterium]|nr:MAG: hypothetical protein FD168_1656 [Desulfobulbaceae bacterium]
MGFPVELPGEGCESGADRAIPTEHLKIHFL